MVIPNTINVAACWMCWWLGGFFVVPGSQFLVITMHQWYNSYYSKSSHLPSISLFKKQKWKWEAGKKKHLLNVNWKKEQRNKKEHWEKEQRDTLNTPPCWSLGSYWNICGPSLGLGGNHYLGFNLLLLEDGMTCYNCWKSSTRQVPLSPISLGSTASAGWYTQTQMSRACQCWLVILSASLQRRS